MISLDRKLLLVAHRMATQATERLRRPTDAIFIDTLATVYEVLADRQADGQDPLDPQFLNDAMRVLRDGKKATVYPFPVAG